MFSAITIQTNSGQITGGAIIMAIIIALLAGLFAYCVAMIVPFLQPYKNALGLCVFAIVLLLLFL